MTSTLKEKRWEQGLDVGPWTHWEKRFGSPTGKVPCPSDWAGREQWVLKEGNYVINLGVMFYCRDINFPLPSILPHYLI